MNDKEAEQIAGKVFELIAARDALEHPRCQCPAGNERHFKHHQLLDQFVEILDRLVEIKWSVLKYLAILGAGALLLVIGLGLSVRLGWLVKP